ncbi:twin-arginine translocation signal domain-containing protein [Halobacterium hubeiense]|nr:twin-arginine translocation signal domain-containing protein [Halobacterium hubeiense]
MVLVINEVMDRKNSNSTSQNRRRFLKASGAALATAVAVPGATAAESGSSASFDPSNRDAVIEYLEWVDAQDNPPKHLRELNEARTDAVVGVMTDVTWSIEEGTTNAMPSTSEIKATPDAYIPEDYEATATGSVGGTTTEYTFTHRIDWSYNNSDYQGVNSTLDPNASGLLAAYVSGSKEVDEKVRDPASFIQRAKAQFRLRGAGKTVTSEVDVSGDALGNGETLLSNAPL